MNFIAIVWVFLGLSLSLSHTHTHTSLVFIRKDELCCNSFDCFRYLSGNSIILLMNISSLHN